MWTDSSLVASKSRKPLHKHKTEQCLELQRKEALNPDLYTPYTFLCQAMFLLYWGLKPKPQAC